MSSWRSLLLRIGERCPEYGGSADFREHIETCYGVLLREFEHSSGEILELVLQCVEQLPHKIPFYAVLVGLINLENEEFVTTIVENLHSMLQAALQSDHCNQIRICLRFLSSLICSKVLLPGSVVELFEGFLSSAATTLDEETGNPAWQPCADFYVSCILSSLPWCALDLMEQAPEELDRVLLGIQSYLRIRKHTPDGALSVFYSEDDKLLDKQDFLEDLWHRIQALSENGWKADSVPRPHLSFEAQLVDGKSHDFLPISFPKQPECSAPISSLSSGREKHEALTIFPRRLHRLNIFSKVENLQPIDRFVVEEYILDVLFFFNGCRKECTSSLVGLPVPFRFEYLMAETIFSQLLMLPEAPFKPLYYTLVIIDLCKALPGAFPAVIAGAVRALFERIGDMDMECRIRLIYWFSHHLSNFQFVWPWDEWSHVIDLPKWAPQRVFVQEVLEKEVRLSYWDKIKLSIENAPAFEELLPPKGGTNFKYSDDGKEKLGAHGLSTEMTSMVKGRKSAQEISSWLEESVIPVHGYRITLEVVIQTFLEIGSKSFTHMITVLERYGQVIGSLCPETDQEKQVQLIEEVSSYWTNNTQMTAITLDRMMGYRLLSSFAIVGWVFSSTNVDQFHLTDRPWEVLRNTVNKTNNRISDLRKEISALELAILSAEKSAIKAKDELEIAESRLEIVDGEPIQAEKPGRLKRLKGYVEKAEDEVGYVRRSLETKRSLLRKASEDSKALFILLFRSFASVFSDRLPDGFTLGEKHSNDGDAMAVDLEGPASMEADQDNQNGKSQTNGENVSNGYKIGEREQWCLSTLGHIKAFSRHYATEIWPHVELLDAEIFGTAHPFFRRAVFAGLGLF